MWKLSIASPNSMNNSSLKKVTERDSFEDFKVLSLLGEFLVHNKQAIKSLTMAESFGELEVH